MTPLTITARLSQPAATAHPIMLDALLYVGLHRYLTASDPARWPGPHPLAEIYDLPLPLAKVEHPTQGWWWAASQATPDPVEAVRYEHRRPAVEAFAAFGALGGGGKVPKVNPSGGPDKALRIPVFVRPRWMSPTWTAVLCEANAAALCGILGLDPVPARTVLHALLRRVPGIGARINRGHGLVLDWEVQDGGPALDSYSTDVTVRHLPVGAVTGTLPARVIRKPMALRPPYYGRVTESCWQVQP